MALTILDSPASNVYARNPAHYNIQTDQYITSGSKPFLTLTMSSNGPQSGDSFTLTIDNTPIVINFIGNVLAANVFEVHGNYTPDAMNTYANNLLAELQLNHALNSYFDIVIVSSSASQAVFKFTSKDGSEFTYTGSMTSTTDAYTAGTADTYAENYKIVIELWQETAFQSGVYERIETLQQTPDEAQKTSFDISAIVEKLLRHELPEYLASAAKIKNTTSIQARFYIKYTDKSGNPVVQNNWNIELSDHLAFLAGVPYPDFPTSGIPADLYGKALTRKPKTLTVIPEQQEYLYFINDKSDVAPQLECTVYFTDGSSMSYAPTITADTVKKNQIAWLSCGYNQLDIGSADANKTVHKYTVRVWDGTNYFTETFTFLVDLKYQEHPRQFLLPNGLGGYDTLYCSGYGQKVLQRQVEISEKPIPSGYAAEDAQLIATMDDPGTFMQATGGPYSPEYARYLEDIFNYNGQAYILGASGWEAIIITSNELMPVKEEEDVRLLSFRYQYAFTQKNAQL